MAQNLVILTGAGISQESGIKTFRDQNGLWEEYRLEDVASPDAFRRDPALVHRFYNLRRRQLSEVAPNAGHRAFAELEAKWPGEFLLLSQNVDDLHARAGSRRLLPMHGELRKVRCEACEAEPVRWEDDLSVESKCEACGRAGFLRPHIVWFGEMPLYMDKIGEALARADLFVSIGTSGNVYPAAGFVQMVPRAARRIELNAAGTEISRAFHEHRRGLATETVPALVRELLEKA